MRSPIHRPFFRFEASLIKTGLSICLLSMAPHIHGADLSLQDAVKRVLTVHPAVQRSHNEVESARSQLDAAKWGQFPSASISSSKGNTGSASHTVRLQQPLWTFGRIERAIGAADAQVRASVETQQLTQVQLTERTSLAFARLYSTREQLALARNNIQRHRELHEFIVRRTDGGLAAMTDIRLSQARLDQVGAREITLQTAAEQARVELTTLMQVSMGEPLAPKPPTLNTTNVDDFVRAFLDNSPTLRRTQELANVAREEADQYKASRMPTVVARLERSPNPFSLTSQYDTRLVIAMDYQSGSGLSRQADYQAQLSKAQALQDDVTVQQQDIESQARVLWSQRNLLLRQQSLLSSMVAASADTVESFRRQFDSGRRTWLDVLNAEREHFEARLTLLQLQATLLELDIRSLIGTGEWRNWLTP